MRTYFLLCVISLQFTSLAKIGIDKDMKKYWSIFNNILDVSLKECGKLPSIVDGELEVTCRQTHGLIKSLNDFKRRSEILSNVKLSGKDYFTVTHGTFGRYLTHYQNIEKRLVKVFSARSEQEATIYCLEYNYACSELLIDGETRLQYKNDIKELNRVVKDCNGVRPRKQNLIAMGETKLSCGQLSFLVKEQLYKSLYLNDSYVLYIVFDKGIEYFYMNHLVYENGKIISTKKTFNKFEIIRYCRKHQLAGCHEFDELSAYFVD